MWYFMALISVMVVKDGVSTEAGFAKIVFVKVV